MVDLITVTSLDMTQPRWRVGLKLPNGESRVHLFAPQTLAFRAAEYEIDPTDSQTLLDIILHERFAPIDQAHPMFVYNTTPGAALIYLQHQIAQAKLSIQVVDPDNHLAPLHASYTPDMNVHTKHKADVVLLRAEKQRVIASPVSIPSP